MTPPKPSVTIIGAGAVGTAWLDFFREAGYPVRSVWKSDSGRWFDPDSGKKKNADSPLPERSEQTGDWVFITTPDDLIENTAQTLSESAIDWSGRGVIHCSGSFSASILRPLSEKGASIASVHPIQTFTRGDDRTRLQQIYMSLQGDPDLVERLESIVREQESHALLLDENQKNAVHIAAVFASNYLVALLHTSDDLLKTHGIAEGVNILAPLIHQTLKNILEKGPEESLTGPIDRGDLSTIQGHLDVLSSETSVKKGATSKKSLYRSFGAVCLEMVRKKGALTEDQIGKLEKLLS